ncbi:unnamed protein product [Ilex paraguariensis]|uniref:Uncharacterized protein n=1 Tax=Ilex paraguariensis TaxID=185542 RepID=A0ABC8V2Y6_9AQUA
MGGTWSFGFSRAAGAHQTPHDMWCSSNERNFLTSFVLVKLTRARAYGVRSFRDLVIIENLTKFKLGPGLVIREASFGYLRMAPDKEIVIKTLVGQKRAREASTSMPKKWPRESAVMAKSMIDP